MLAHETLTRFNPYRGAPYHFPGQTSDIPGLHGLFLAGTRTHADAPQVFETHVQKGYIDQYLAYEMKYQPPEVQKLLAGLLHIPDAQDRTEALFSLLQEVSEGYAYPTPEWVKTGKPMYQIMVDRFYNPELDASDNRRRQCARAEWQELQSRQDRDFYDNVHFAGGTIAGVMAKMDYLKSIAGGLYLNPIFEADTIHGYNSADYFSVNHRLAGFADDEYEQADEMRKAEIKCEGLQQFDQLTDEIPVVLDIAVNHTGRAHNAFKDIEQNGTRSPYKEWYQDIVFDEQGNLSGWKGWWGHDTLPVLDHHAPAVKQHFLGEGYQVGIAAEDQSDEWKYWVAAIQDVSTRKDVLSDPKRVEEAQKQLGVIGFWSAMMSGTKSDGSRKFGGWRLDVPNDINRPEFWNEFRMLVKSIDPELWIVGEIWDNDNEAVWLNGDKFDGVMNYRFWQWTLDYLIGDTPTRRQHLSSDRTSPANASQFADRVKWFTSRHPKHVVETMMNNAGTHDVIRIGDLLNNPDDTDKTELGLTILMTLPGVPSIWAGDERRMNNHDCPIVTDPMNRKPINWHDEPNGVLQTVLQLAALREQSSALHTSNIRFIPTGQDDVLSYLRTSDEDAPSQEAVLVLINRSNDPKPIPLTTLTKNGADWQEYVAEQGTTYAENYIILPPCSSTVYTGTP